MIFLSAAMIERDGYLIICGTIMFVITLAFFGALFFGGAALVGWLGDWVGSIFDPKEKLPEDFPIQLPAELPLPADLPPAPVGAGAGEL